MISLRKNKGFTIVELLIVIVVIGILATLVITAYSGIQQKARNSKRQTDLSALQTHLEAFYNDNGYYPSLTDMNNQNFINNLKGLDQTALIDPSNPSQSKTLVQYPVAKSYAYTVTDSNSVPCEANHEDCAKYKLTATYEGTVNGATVFIKSSLN
ncbi:MAG: prepilin-type N-terminal cleavage/methylation domain-containing protein [bacterium]|jgi:prepilin-type N-terminal cleavage/methylation domain-containing protein